MFNGIPIGATQTLILPEMIDTKKATNKNTQYKGEVCVFGLTLQLGFR